VQIDQFGQLPASLPDVPERLGLSYVPDVVREYTREATQPVIIGSSVPHELILGGEGNSVLIYDRGKVRCEWWPRTRFVSTWHAQSARIQQWDLARRATPPQLP
jgi:hypothetical protein